MSEVGRARVLVVSLVLALGACGGSTDNATPDQSIAESPAPSAPSIPLGALPGRLMFSRFDEETHTFISTHVARPDGSDETEIPLPGPEGGGRWSRAATRSP